MPKRRLTLSVALPPYRHPRNEWRRLIHRAARDAQTVRNVHYLPSDKLEVQVSLNLSPSASLHHDVDNRLKDILDALQGRAGGSKALHALKPIVPNDRQIYRVSIEKSPRADRKRPRGKITIRKVRGWRSIRSSA